MERFNLLSAVHLILIKEEKILLLRRFNTGWNDGNYTVPAGHLDEGETVTQAVVRESLEEAGVTIKPEDLTMVHVMHRAANRIDFFFIARAWQGNPTNAEPDKCDDLEWFPLDNLPSNMVEYVKSGIEHYQNGKLFSEFGW
ncbi:MAG: NUDIX domain-containing protein [Minisyncoccia bacterium]